MIIDNSTTTAIFSFLLMSVISLAIYIWKKSEKQSEKMESEFADIKQQLTEVNTKVTAMDRRITKNEENGEVALAKIAENEKAVNLIIASIKDEFRETRHKILGAVQSQSAELIVQMEKMKTEISREYMSKDDHHEKCGNVKTIVERIDKKLDSRSEGISYRD